MAPTVIGDEKAFLQGVHHCIAKVVAVGEVIGTSALRFVTACAVEESAGGRVERRQRLQKKLQRSGGIVGDTWLDLRDEPRMVLDDFEHAHPKAQRMAAELVTDRQAGLCLGLQVVGQRLGILRVEVGAADRIARAGHDVPPQRGVSTSA